jgi:hypothetical protein
MELIAGIWRAFGGSLPAPPVSPRCGFTSTTLLKAEAAERFFNGRGNESAELRRLPAEQELSTRWSVIWSPTT